MTVTCLMPGATETEFFRRAEMMDTDIGTIDKDDPGEVAKNGFDAMIKGEGDVVSGLKNKVQSAAANVTPASILARPASQDGRTRHRKEMNGTRRGDWWRGRAAAYLGIDQHREQVVQDLFGEEHGWIPAETADTKTLRKTLSSGSWWAMLKAWCAAIMRRVSVGLCKKDNLHSQSVLFFLALIFSSKYST